MGRSSAYQKARLDTWQTEIFPAGFLERGFQLLHVPACVSCKTHTVHVTFVSPAFGGVLICGVAATPTTPSFYASIVSTKEHVTILAGGGGGGGGWSPKAELCIESLLVMSHVGIIEHNYI